MVTNRFLNWRKLFVLTICLLSCVMVLSSHNVAVAIETQSYSTVGVDRNEARLMSEFNIEVINNKSDDPVPEPLPESSKTINDDTLELPETQQEQLTNNSIDPLPHTGDSQALFILVGFILFIVVSILIFINRKKFKGNIYKLFNCSMLVFLLFMGNNLISMNTNAYADTTNYSDNAENSKYIYSSMTMKVDTEGNVLDYSCKIYNDTDNSLTVNSFYCYNDKPFRFDLEIGQIIEPHDNLDFRIYDINNTYIKNSIQDFNFKNNCHTQATYFRNYINFTTPTYKVSRHIMNADIIYRSCESYYLYNSIISTTFQDYVNGKTNINEFEPIVEDYGDFIGWENSQGELVDDDYFKSHPITEDIELYARWENSQTEKAVNIHYYKPFSKHSRYNFGHANKLLGNPNGFFPSKGLNGLKPLDLEGYIFLGWYTKIDGGDKVDFIEPGSKSYDSYGGTIDGHRCIDLYPHYKAAKDQATNDTNDSSIDNTLENYNVLATDEVYSDVSTEIIDNVDIVDSILDSETGSEINARKEEVLNEGDVSITTDADIGKLDSLVEEFNPDNT